MLKASPSAVWGEYIPFMLLLGFLLIGALALLFIDPIFWVLLVGLLVVAFPILLISMGLFYLRLKNTTYTVYPDRIEGLSCTFRFLGYDNNLVNLKQIRQIRAFNNSILDVWFFHCGRVDLLVSGDFTDFKVENVYMPEAVKAKLEEICFGSRSLSRAMPDRPSVG